MSQTTLSSRAGGDAAESAVLEAVAELQYVPDTDAEHYDALTTTAVVAELVSSWIIPDGRADYAQLAWSRVFAPAEVHG